MTILGASYLFGHPMCMINAYLSCTVTFYEIRAYVTVKRNTEAANAFENFKLILYDGQHR